MSTIRRRDTNEEQQDKKRHKSGKGEKDDGGGEWRKQPIALLTGCASTFTCPQLHRTHPPLSKWTMLPPPTLHHPVHVVLLNNVAICALFGIRGIARNVKWALSLLHTAAAASTDPIVISNLAICWVLYFTETGEERLLPPPQDRAWQTLARLFAHFERTESCAVASFNLALCYMEGVGVPKDSSASRARMTRLAPDMEAARRYLLYLRMNSGTEPFRNIFDSMQQLANAGDELAEYNLGCYLSSDSNKPIPKDDTKTAMKHLTMGAELGSTLALMALASTYYEAGNYELASVHSTRAALRLNLSDMLCAGRRCYKIQRYREAVEWFQRAAVLQGDAKAHGFLARIYEEGVLDIPKDADLSHRHHEAAAHAGLSVSQAHMGLCYLEGRYVEKDPLRAIQWLTKSFENNGNLLAIYHLAQCQELGVGTPQNLRESCVLYYRLAAALLDEDKHSDYSLARKAEEKLVALRLLALKAPASGKTEPEACLPGLVVTPLNVPVICETNWPSSTYRGMCLLPFQVLCLADNTHLHLIGYDGTLRSYVHGYGKEAVTDVLVNPSNGRLTACFQTFMVEYDMIQWDKKMFAVWEPIKTFREVPMATRESDGVWSRAGPLPSPSGPMKHMAPVDVGVLMAVALTKDGKLIPPAERRVAATLLPPELHKTVLYVDSAQNAVFRYEWVSESFRPMIEGLKQPKGLAYDAPTGDLYISEESCIRRCRATPVPATLFQEVTGLPRDLCEMLSRYAVTFGSKVERFAGSEKLYTTGFENGLAGARFRWPQALCIDAKRRLLFVWDAGNRAVRAVELPPVYAPSPSYTYQFDRGEWSE